jgi:cytochrome P450
MQYETLRVYPQVLSIPKCTGETPQVLKTEEREITVPPHTHVFPSCIALQTDPDSWGSDSLAWRPDRWIKSSGIGFEDFVSPIKGSYIPWSDGPRVCPGKKFSMVEFVSVIAVLLWKHRIEIIPQMGESQKEARERVYRVVEDSATHFTLQMRNPKSVGLKIVHK